MNFDNIFYKKSKILLKNLQIYNDLDITYIENDNKKIILSQYNEQSNILSDTYSYQGSDYINDYSMYYDFCGNSTTILLCFISERKSPIRVYDMLSGKIISNFTYKNSDNECENTSCIMLDTTNNILVAGLNDNSLLNVDIIKEETSKIIITRKYRNNNNCILSSIAQSPCSHILNNNFVLGNYNSDLMIIDKRIYGIKTIPIFDENINMNNKVKCNGINEIMMYDDYKLIINPRSSDSILIYDARNLNSIFNILKRSNTSNLKLGLSIKDNYMLYGDDYDGINIYNTKTNKLVSKSRNRNYENPITSCNFLNRDCIVSTSYGISIWKKIKNRNN